MIILNEQQIKNSQQYLAELSSKITEKSKLFSIGSDPTRLKIIYLLKIHQQLCVTDLAAILNISMSAVSHQMSLLERADLVAKQRKGQVICYSIEHKNIKIKNLLD